jgi:hypothetical protein
MSLEGLLCSIGIFLPHLLWGRAAGNNTVTVLVQRIAAAGVK